MAVASPILSVVATAYIIGRRVAVIETTQVAHTKTLESLPDVLRGFVTQQEGKGYQAQLDRLERNDAECEGKLSSQRQEVSDRMERLGARLAAYETTQTAATSDLRASLSRMEATFSAGIQALKDSLDRIHHERAQAPQPDLFTQLQQFVQLQKMLKGANP